MLDILAQNLKDILRNHPIETVSQALGLLHSEVAEKKATYESALMQLAHQKESALSAIQARRDQELGALQGQITHLQAQIDGLGQQMQNLTATYDAQVQDQENHFENQKRDLSAHMSL